jgi:hypothetical protein
VFSVNAFKALSADDQSKIVEFMSSLGRQENIDAAPVNLGIFQFKRTDTNERLSIPTGRFVPHGGFLVVARSATKAEFEASMRLLPSQERTDIAMRQLNR